MSCHPEILARAFEIRHFYQQLQLLIPLHKMPLPTFHGGEKNPFPGCYSPLKAMNPLDPMQPAFSAIGLSPPRSFVAPHLLQPPTAFYHSVWGKRIHNPNLNNVQPLTKTGDAKGSGDSGRGSMVGERAKNSVLDPSVSMRRLGKV